jgi:membrane peptidoglycan carboxypeptidase
VTRAELPDHLVQALLAIEDRRFYDHMGLDALGIVRAAWRNFMAGGIVQGGSTLTQQLAKVLFLSPEQTLHRKLQEAAIATWIDTRYTKDEILTKYLDSVYFGAGATGITAAAKVYFDKPVAELNLAESAMLAGLVRAPSRLNPRSNLKAARERATLVLHAMVESDSISLDQALEAALNSAAPVRGLAVAQTGSWFGDWAYNEVKYAMGPLAGAARVRTTLQPKIQALAERVVAESLARGGAEGKIGQAALVALDLNGAVLAMVGGRSYAESQFNRATDAQRQPGSAFKTFVYMAALRAGWSPEDVIVDEPINIDGWKPKNYSGRYAGKVSLEQAFARSLNASTVKLAQEVGLDQVIATAHDLGIDATLEPNLTLSLGTAEVTLLDLTGAYASIAAGRAPVQPVGHCRVVDEGWDGTQHVRGAERQTSTRSRPGRRW